MAPFIKWLPCDLLVAWLNNVKTTSVHYNDMLWTDLEVNDPGENGPASLGTRARRTGAFEISTTPSSFSLCVALSPHPALWPRSSMNSSRARGASGRVRRKRYRRAQLPR